MAIHMSPTQAAHVIIESADKRSRSALEEIKRLVYGDDDYHTEIEASVKADTAASFEPLKSFVGEVPKREPRKHRRSDWSWAKRSR